MTGKCELRRVVPQNVSQAAQELRKTLGPVDIAAARSQTGSFVLDDAPGKFQGLQGGFLHVLRHELGDEFLNTFAYDPFSSNGVVGVPHPLPLRFIEARVPQDAPLQPSMLQRYRELQEMGRAMQREAFSDSVIVVGETTTEDLNFYLMTRAERDLGLRITSSPGVSLFRKDVGELSGPHARIQKGDMLRSDWGLRGFGDSLWSDNTVLGYVGSEPSEELLKGLAKANQLQGMWLAACTHCALRKPLPCTGSEFADEITRRMAIANWTAGTEDCGKADEPRCDGSIMSHPIGDFMHSAGPYIETAPSKETSRRAPREDGVPHRRASPHVLKAATHSTQSKFRGDDVDPSDWRALRVRPNSWFSMELAAFAPWGSLWQEFNLEQQIYVDREGKCATVLPRQTEFFKVAQTDTELFL